MRRLSFLSLPYPRSHHGNSTACIIILHIDVHYSMSSPTRRRRNKRDRSLSLSSSSDASHDHLQSFIFCCDCRSDIPSTQPYGQLLTRGVVPIIEGRACQHTLCMMCFSKARALRGVNLRVSCPNCGHHSSSWNVHPAKVSGRRGAKHSAHNGYDEYYMIK